ncbi:MAG: hypothetical protein IKR43_02380, partial [Lachnospiraceae bacterium]|nr:hypothetical protein [Lachnospiraceae bacterium]
MKLFFYYVTHSAKNALKKLFKTWVLVFFVIIIGGGLLIGGTIGLLIRNAVPKDPEPGIATEVPNTPAPEDEVPIMDVMELAAGGVVLLFFVIGV